MSSACYNGCKSLFGRDLPPANLQGVIHSQLQFAFFYNQCQFTLLMFHFWINAICMYICIYTHISVSTDAG